VARGDSGTVAAHRGALDEYAHGHGGDDVLLAYLNLARVTARRALDRGLLDRARYDAVLAALDPADGKDTP